MFKKKANLPWVDYHIYVLLSIVNSIRIPLCVSLFVSPWLSYMLFQDLHKSIRNNSVDEYANIYMMSFVFICFSFIAGLLLSIFSCKYAILRMHGDIDESKVKKLQNIVRSSVTTISLVMMCFAISQFVASFYDNQLLIHSGISLLGTIVLYSSYRTVSLLCAFLPRIPRK